MENKQVVKAKAKVKAQNTQYMEIDKWLDKQVEAQVQSVYMERVRLRGRGLNSLTVALKPRLKRGLHVDAVKDRPVMLIVMKPFHVYAHLETSL